MSLDKVKNVVLVLSGKGGVGKSSITTQLALGLTLRGHSVGILDVDLTGPSIPRFLDIEASQITQAPGGWLPVEVHAAQKLAALSGSPPPAPSEGSAPTSTDPPPAPPTSAGPLYAMSLGLLLASRSASIVWRGPKKTAMVRQFLTDVLWPELDYLLIDTPPGTSDEHISLAESLLRTVADAAVDATKRAPNIAGAVVVTTPQAVAISDVRKELNFCAKTSIRVIGVVENMSGYVCPCCGVSTKVFSSGGGKVMAEEFGVPFLGAVPIDGLWGELIEEGKRPAYESVAVPDVDGDDEDEEMEVERENEAREKAKEPGLLVDKYRSCSLWPIFNGIAAEVHERTEKGTAVTLPAG